MKKVSGAAPEKRHVTLTVESSPVILSPMPEAQCTSELPLKNYSIVSEVDILDGAPRCEIRSRLRRYNTLVRDGKMRRIVIKGTPFYVALEASS